MADIRIINGADGEKHIMRGNTCIGYVAWAGTVYLFDNNDEAVSIGTVDHPSEAVTLVTDYIKRPWRV